MEINSLSEREKTLIRIRKKFPEMDFDEIDKLYESAEKGGEIERCGSVESWFEDKASYGLVALENDDYVVALTHALRIAPKLAATDYGTSRQRDLGQSWTDTARGFLGEIALAKFMKERFNVEIVPDYSLGSIENYLPSDIKSIKLGNGELVEPKIKVSFKTTKFNGIWLDVPGAQFWHSDMFVLIKIGITREHFVAFLKKISFVKDKLIPSAKKIGTIDDKQAEQLWDSLPEFKKIYCYIAGFIDKEQLEASHDINYRVQHNRQGNIKGYLMRKYCGWVKNNKPQEVGEELRESNWEYASIVKFSSQDRFIASTGCLLYSAADWGDMVGKLIHGK